MKNRTVKYLSLCALSLLMANCVKTEPLDVEKDYKQQLTERAKQEQQREAEAKAKAEAEAQKKMGCLLPNAHRVQTKSVG